MNWDDLRIVAAVSEAGSYAGAGLALRIDETTVARRLSRLERTLGVRLFEAVDGVRRPTPQCEAVLARVHAIAVQAADIARLGALAHGVAGHFRIACTNSIAEEFLAPRAAKLLAANRGLSLQFLTSSDNVKFSRWEADMAVRLRKPDKGDFTITRLADIRLCFVEPARPPDAAPIVCGYPESLDLIPEAQFLKARGLQQQIRCVTDNIGVIRALVRSHRAVGILPEYFCGVLARDRRLKITPLARRRELWLLVQNHLRRDAAARRVIDWVRESFRALARG